ncbi:hypothetical protein [Egbenema bharatensis]
MAFRINAASPQFSLWWLYPRTMNAVEVSESQIKPIAPPVSEVQQAG